MFTRRFLFTGAATMLVSASVIAAQAPARGRAAAQPPAAPVATLAQVMRGILFPSSNVIFAAQRDQFATVKPADPSGGEANRCAK